MDHSEKGIHRLPVRRRPLAIAFSIALLILGVAFLLFHFVL